MKWVNVKNEPFKRTTPQNGQTHSNNCLSVFDHFVGLAFKGLRIMIIIIFLL